MVTVSYDSFGRRTGKTINSTTTNFVYDGLNSVQEKNGSTDTANLLTGLGIDEFFTRTDGVGARALLTDALGSTVALGDSARTRKGVGSHLLVHIFYDVAGGLTFSYYANKCDCINEEAAAVLDFFNPLSLPNDILEAMDELREE